MIYFLYISEYTQTSIGSITHWKKKSLRRCCRRRQWSVTNFNFLQTFKKTKFLLTYSESMWYTFRQIQTSAVVLGIALCIFRIVFFNLKLLQLNHVFLTATFDDSPSSQKSPRYPSWHEQTIAPLESSQVPPFRHGCSLQVVNTTDCKHEQMNCF